MNKNAPHTVTLAELKAAAAHIDATGLPHMQLDAPPSFRLVVVKHGPGYFSMYFYKTEDIGYGCEKCLAYTWHGEWSRNAATCHDVKIEL